MLLGMNVSRFEDLIAWQKARELAREIYVTTSNGKFGQDFGLRDQIRRAGFRSCRTSPKVSSEEARRNFITF